MELPNRKLPRLPGYDYATPGAYFITICTHGKACTLGTVRQNHDSGDYMVQYTPIGKVAKKHLLEIEKHYPNIKIDNWVIMPNHIHILLQIKEQINPLPTVTASYDIPNVIGKYKAGVSRDVGNAFMHSGKLWQSSYYDHVIRGEEDYQNIWQYISGNPSKWLEDRLYVED